MNLLESPDLTTCSTLYHGFDMQGRVQNTHLRRKRICYDGHGGSRNG